MAKRKNPLYVGSDRVTKKYAIVKDESSGAKKYSDEFAKLVYVPTSSQSQDPIAIPIRNILTALLPNTVGSIAEIEEIRKTHPNGDDWDPETDALMAFLGYLQDDFSGKNIAKTITSAKDSKSIIKILVKAHKGLLSLKIKDGAAKAQQNERLQESIAAADETKKASDKKRLAEISNAYIALNFRYTNKPPTDDELKELKRKVEAHNKQVAAFRQDESSKEAFVAIELERLKGQVSQLIGERATRREGYLAEKAEKDWERVEDNYSNFRYYVEPDSLKMTLLKMLLGYSVPVYGRDSSGRLDFKKTQYFTYAGQNRNQFNVVQPGFTSGPKKNLFDVYKELNIQKTFPQWIKDNYIKELRDFVPNISVAREISFDARATEGTLDRLELATLQGTFSDTLESILQQQDIQSGRVDYEESLNRLESLVTKTLPEVFEKILKYQSRITFDENIGCFYPKDFAELYDRELAAFDLNVVLPKYSAATGKSVESIDTEDSDVIDEIWDWYLLDKYEYLRKMSSSESDIASFFVRKPSDLTYTPERERQLYGQSMGGGDFTPDYTYWNAFKKVTKDVIEDARIRLRVSYLNYRKYLASIETTIEFRAQEKQLQYLQSLLQMKLSSLLAGQDGQSTRVEEIKPLWGMYSDSDVQNFKTPFTLNELYGLKSAVIQRLQKADFDPATSALIKRIDYLLQVFSLHLQREASIKNISQNNLLSYIGDTPISKELYLELLRNDSSTLRASKFKLGTASKLIENAIRIKQITQEEGIQLKEDLKNVSEANSTLEATQQKLSLLGVDNSIDYKKLYLDAVGVYHEIMERAMRQQGLKQKDARKPAYPKVSRLVGVQLGNNQNEYCTGRVIEVDYMRKVAKILPEDYKEKEPYVSKVLLAPFYYVFSEDVLKTRPPKDAKFLQTLVLAPPNDAYSIFNVCLAKDVPINVGDYREYHVMEGKKHITRSVEIMVMGPLGRRDKQYQVVEEDALFALNDKEVLVAIAEDGYVFDYNQLYKVSASSVGPLILTKEQALQWPDLYNSPQQYDEEFLKQTKMQVSETLPQNFVRHNPHRSVSSNFAIWTLWGSCLNIMLTDILQSREFKDVASLIESFSTTKKDILELLRKIEENTKSAIDDPATDSSTREKLQKELKIIKGNILNVEASSSALEVLSFIGKDDAESVMEPISRATNKAWHELKVDDLVLYLIQRLRIACYKPYDIYMQRNFMDQESRLERREWRAKKDTLVLKIEEANKKLQEYQDRIEKLEKSLKISPNDAQKTKQLKQLEKEKTALSKQIVEHQQKVDKLEKTPPHSGRSAVPFSHGDIYENLFTQWQKSFITQNYSGLSYYWSLRTNWISTEEVETRQTRLGSLKIPTYTNRFAEVSSKFEIPQIYFRNNETSVKNTQPIIKNSLDQPQSYQYYLLDNFKNSETSSQGQGFYILKNKGNKDYVFERKLENAELSYIKPYFYVPINVYESLKEQVEANQRKLLQTKQQQYASLQDKKSGEIVSQTSGSVIVPGSDGSQKVSGTRERKKARNNPKTFRNFGEFYTKCIDPFKLIVEYIIVSDYMRLKRRRK
jgi:hypothetical protein